MTGVTGRQKLLFDGLNFVARRPNAQGWWLEVEAADANFGNPKPVEVGIESLISDGAIVEWDHDENRDDAYFRVAVRGVNSRARGRGEKALMMATRKRTEMRWIPYDGLSPWTVFDVLTSSLSHITDDEAEFRRDARVYGLRMVLAPHVRSDVKRERTHASGTAVVNTINDASAVAPWVNPLGLSRTAVTYQGETSIKLVGTGPAGSLGSITYQGTLGAGNYLGIDIAYANGALSGPFGLNLGAPKIYKPGTSAKYSAIASEVRNTYFVRYFYPHLGGSDVTLEWESQSFDAATPLYIGGLYRSTQVPSAAGFMVDVKGSVRTPAEFEVVGTAGKGLLLFVDPLMSTYGYDPKNPATWTRLPEGSYTVMFKLQSPASLAADTVIVSPYTSGSYVRRLGQAVTAGEYIDIGTAYATRNYDGTANLSLPALEAHAPALFSPTLGAPIAVNGSYRIFRRAPNTRLIFAGRSTDLGSGTFRFISPSLEYPRGGAFIGNTPMDGDTLKAWDFPLLTPPYTGVYCEMASDPNPDLTVRYYDRHHTHVVEEPEDG